MAEIMVKQLEVNYNMEVKFYNCVEDSLLKFAVIVAKHNGNWVFCKHRERNTYEVPGGHREANEIILDTTKRELLEKTGTCEYEIKPICVYSVIGKTRVNDSGRESYGMLYYADIKTFGKLPKSEIEKVCFFENLPTEMTYPLIQPKLVDKVQHYY